MNAQTWPPHTPGRSLEFKPEQLIQNFWTKLDGYAGLEKLEGFSLKEMFSEVMKRRSPDELDEYFVGGTAPTTPPLESVPTEWPKPWFFARVLIFVGAVYALQYVMFQQFQNILVLPGMMMMGALAMPLATALLFFELNVVRNVAFHRTMILVCAGGVLSIFISLIGFDLSQLHRYFGAPAAGVVEEIGKLMTVLLMTRKLNQRYILNGCLFGAAVGAGFAAFESAGYSFAAFYRVLPEKSSAGLALGATAMADSILMRGVLAPFGHVAWTAISAGALWRARAKSTSWSAALTDRSFLRALLLVMVLHATWNFAATFLPTIFERSVQAAVGLASWYVVFGIVQQGLRQVKAAQRLASQGAAGSDPSASTAAMGR